MGVLKILLCWLALYASVAAVPVSPDNGCPFAPLPAPTGKYAVGTLVLPPERLHGSGTSRRVQLWYPAGHDSQAPFAPYLPDAGSIEVFREVKFLDQPECVFENWSKAKTHARDGAAPAKLKGKAPLAMISPGAGMARMFYTAYAEQLASDGFVVATIDYASDGILIQDGKALDEGPKEDDEATFAKVAEDWAAHISEVIDELTEGKIGQADPAARKVAQLVDGKRIASMGHSLGGEASLMACEKDKRLRACMDFDGGLTGSKLAETGLESTALILHSHPIYSDADLAKRHRTREQFEQMGHKALSEMQALFAKPGGDAWVLSIAGTGHLSFSDAPFTMPTTISRFGGTSSTPPGS